MKWLNLVMSLTVWMMVAGLPASTNYQLNSYGFGSGGGSSSSTNYKANGITGEQAGSASSTNYQAGAGENYLKQANVPLVTLSNPGNWYDKLDITITPNGNPTDAKFAIAITDDNFTTTEYVQSDFTIGPTLTSSDFLTYSGWGGASGVTLRYLTPNTIYEAKAAATRGTFTQSQWGPVSTSTTTAPAQLEFALGVNPTYAITSPPYSINFGQLLAGTVETAPDKIWVTLSTNADNGAMVYADGEYGGLESAYAGHLISSLNGNIAAASEGFGMQDSSVTQSSGGPLTTVSPYNGSGNNVGEDYTGFDQLFGTSGNYITTGEGGISLLAKSQVMTPQGSDYTETLTIVAAGSF
jgi:hypothetical protein